MLLKIVITGDHAFLLSPVDTKLTVWYCYCCFIAKRGSYQNFPIISKKKSGEFNDQDYI